MRNHLSAAIGKTGARTRAGAVRIAEENGWLLGDIAEQPTGGTDPGGAGRQDDHMSGHRANDWFRN